MENQKTFLTLPEASNYLGLTKSYLYKLTSNKSIRHFKPGGKNIYFNINDLDEFILSGEIKSQAEIQTEALQILNGGV